MLFRKNILNPCYSIFFVTSFLEIKNNSTFNLLAKKFTIFLVVNSKRKRIVKRYIKRVKDMNENDINTGF